jgi:NAD(P)-dependent dehydrogenase (short-subunit alcohol dehydrogenase family)
MAEERRAMVVGASRGLGLGLAAELRRRGWAVATARDAVGAARLEALAARPGSGLVAENVDITDAPVVDALRRRMDGQVLDLLFVNAGIAGPPHQDAARVASEEITALFLTMPSARSASPGSFSTSSATVPALLPS